jgi:hypothetical protein
MWQEDHVRDGVGAILHDPAWPKSDWPDDLNALFELNASGQLEYHSDPRVVYLGTFKEGVRDGVGMAVGRRNTLPGAWMFVDDSFLVRSPGSRSWVMRRARWVTPKSSLGDVKRSLGDAKSSLGDAKSSLGDAKSSLGDVKSSLGDAKSSLGDAKSLAG